MWTAGSPHRELRNIAGRQRVRKRAANRQTLIAQRSASPTNANPSARRRRASGRSGVVRPQPGAHSPWAVGTWQPTTPKSCVGACPVIISATVPAMQRANLCGGIRRDALGVVAAGTKY